MKLRFIAKMGQKGGWKQFPSPNGAALGAGNLDPFSSPVVALTSPSAPAAHGKPGPQGHLGREFCQEHEDVVPFSSRKKSAAMENISGNTPARVHSPGQWHRAWQGHRCGTQLSLGRDTACPLCLSPPTATHCGQQGSFPPFKVSGMWLEGLKPKGRCKPVFPHSPAASRGPEAGTAPGPLPAPWVAGAALVTRLCVPQPRRIIFQEFV